ncbi:hypothetical protein D3C74_428190 [compost metagenome]
MHMCVDQPWHHIFPGKVDCCIVTGDMQFLIWGDVFNTSLFVDENRHVGLQMAAGVAMDQVDIF